MLRVLDFVLRQAQSASVVGRRQELVVDDFAWDYGPGGNIEHLRGHEIEREDIEAVLRFGPLYFRNPGAQTSTHAMVGRDSKNRSLLIYLIPTPAPGVWKPVTGWRSGLAHQLLEREGRT